MRRRTVHLQLACAFQISNIWKEIVSCTQAYAETLEDSARTSTHGKGELYLHWTPNIAGGEAELSSITWGGGESPNMQVRSCFKEICLIFSTEEYSAQ